MAGHPITDSQRSQEDFELLQKLINSHDAIFLLMDTRESRWLPTVMGKSENKIVMNAALGFDTFVAMRHGLPDPTSPASELGCYFCSDVVAPANVSPQLYTPFLIFINREKSVKDQSLDQQCTVTRPGVAAIASALLVELFVSILQHPKGATAPAPSSRSREGDVYQHPLGTVPHQIRGFLSDFSNVAIAGQSYDCCSACSSTVVTAYRNDGWEFVQRALNEDDYVESLSGLKEVSFLSRWPINSSATKCPRSSGERRRQPNCSMRTTTRISVSGTERYETWNHTIKYSLHGITSQDISISMAWRNRFSHVFSRQRAQVISARCVSASVLPNMLLLIPA